MPDKSQELKTNIVFGAADALKNITAIQEALDKVSSIKFDNITQSMKTFQSAVKEAGKATSTTATLQKKQEEEFQNILQRRNALIKEMTDNWSKNSNAVNTDGWKKQERDLVDLNGQVSRYCKEIGKAQQQFKYLDQAMQLTKDTPLFDSFTKQWSKAKAELQQLKNLQKQLTDDATGVTAAKNRAQEQKAIADRVKANLAESKAARAAKEAAEISSAQKIAQEKKNISDARIAQELDNQKKLQAESKKSYSDEQKRMADTAKNLKADIQDRIKNQETVAKAEEQSSKARQRNIEKARRLEESRIRESKKEQSRTNPFTVNTSDDAKAGFDKYFKLLRQAEALQDRINKHKGTNGQFYTREAYQADVKRLASLKDQLHSIGAEQAADKLNASMFNGVNVKSSKSRVTDSGAKEELLTMEKLKEKARELYEIQQKTNSTADKLRFDIARNQLHDMESSERKFNESLNRSVLSAERLKDALGRRAKWIASGMVVGGAMAVPSETIHSYIDLEKAMAGVQQVIPALEATQSEANRDFKSYSDKVQRVNEEMQTFVSTASEYAQSLSDVAEAAQLWGRGYGHAEDAASTMTVKMDWDAEKQGYEKVTGAIDEETRSLMAMKTVNELTSQSAMLAAVDNFSMGESVRGLESILSAYNMRAKSATEATLFAGRAVDIVSKVAHNGQISAKELVAGIEQTGTAASQAGMSLEFLSAMIETGVRNTGKSGSEIGQAVKSLAVGIHSKKGIDELKKIGIEISKIGSDGVRRLRPVQDVILDISSAMQKGSKNAEQMLLAISGGRYQYSKISAILRDQGELTRMWSKAIDSNGFAKSQLEVQMNTIDAKIKKLKANIMGLMQALATSTGGSFVKGLLDALNRALIRLKQLKSLLAVAPVLAGFVVAIRMIVKMDHILQSARSSWGAYQKAVSKATAAGVGYTAQTKRSSVAQSASNRATAAASTIFGTKAKEAKKASVSVKAETDATRKNTYEQKANGVEMKKGSTILTRNVNFRKMNAKAVNAETVSTKVLTKAKIAEEAENLRLAASEAMVTFGLNVAVGLLATAALGWLTSADSVNKQTYALEENKEITDATVESANDQAQALEQEVTAREEQVKWLETAWDRYGQLKEATAGLTDEQKKSSKSWEEMQTLENNFTKVLGLDAEQREKIKDWDADTWAQELSNFKEKNSGMREDLGKLRTALYGYYLNAFQWNKKQAEVYRNSIKNFGTFEVSQLTGLNKLQRAWYSFFQFIYKIDKAIADWANEEKEKALTAAAAAPTDGIKDFFNAVATGLGVVGDVSGWNANNAEWLGELVVDGEDVKASDAAASAAAKIQEMDGNFPAPDMYDGQPDNGSYEPSGGKPQKGEKGPKEKKGEEPHYIIDYTNERDQVFHNMLGNGTFKEQGWTFGKLKAFNDMMSSGMGDLFSLSDSMKKFLPQGMSASDPFANAYAFQQWALNFGANQDGMNDIFKAIFGKDWKDKKHKVVNDGDWADSHTDYGKNNKTIYGQPSASGNSQLRDLVVYDASQYVSAGTPYVYGGNDISGIDCSGLVNTILSSLGISISRAADDQAGDFINKNAYHKGTDGIKPGDPIFMTGSNPGNYGVGHVGIYAGDGKMIEAAHSGTQVRYASISGRDVVGYGDLAAYSGDKGKGKPSAKINWIMDGRDDDTYTWKGDEENRERQRNLDKHEDDESKYKMESERNARLKEYYGESESYYRSVNALQKNHLEILALYNAKFAENYSKTEQTFDNFIHSNANAKEALKRANVGDFYNLSYEEQKDLISKLAKSEGEEGQYIQKIYNFLHSNRDKVEQNDIDLQKASDEYEKSQHGYLSPHDKYTHKKEIISNTEAKDYDAKLDQARKIAQLDDLEYQRKLKQYQDSLVVDHEEMNRLLQDRLKLEKELTDLKDPDRKKFKKDDDYNKAKEEVDSKRKALQSQIADKKSAYRDLDENGSQNTQGAEKDLQAQRKMKKESEKTLRELKAKFRQAGADITVDFFDKLTQKGTNLRSILQDIWKDIGKIAVRRAIFSMFGVKNKPLEEEGDLGVLLSGIGRKKKKSPAARSFVSNWMAKNTYQRPKFDLLNIKSKDSGYNLLTKGTKALTFSLKKNQTATQSQTNASKDQTKSTDKATVGMSNAASMFGNMIGGKAGKYFGAAAGVLPLFGFNTGGYIPGYASGGQTDGLIDGAGTGTSDSILTYLEHRKQFIRSSKGEFIFKKDTVDALGVPFLDLLNNNPDALKKYADGGSLGDDYAPVVSPSTTASYKGLTANKTAIKMNSNAKLEELMQQQNDMIGNLGKNESGGQVVVLNTHASSNDVLAALNKNPRAVQTILGKQRHMGFR